MTALCGLFLWNNIMATDVDVQYFSHLNGLVLGNNWGDLIRLLDKTLVTGIAFTEITAASIDDQGDVHITLYSAHNALLFQVVELTGFTPNSFNQKYRIKGTPSATELILKPSTVITEKNVITKGIGKLSSLGYEIIFRDTGDVKRVYRAKNPRVEHPFIRVDESLTSPDGMTGVYNSSYAKSAMVGLLENMTHIDDYENPEVLQLPFDPTNPTKNWKITGTSGNVVRGWSKWHWSINTGYNDYIYETGITPDSNANFTICGDCDAFYLLPAASRQIQKQFWGAGTYEQSINTSKPPYFLFTMLDEESAQPAKQFAVKQGGTALSVNSESGSFLTNKIDVLKFNHIKSNGVLPDYATGLSDIHKSNNVAALDIPICDDDKYLKGVLMHTKYAGKKITTQNTSIEISNNSMYLKENIRHSSDFQYSSCGVYFYLGELE